MVPQDAVLTARPDEIPAWDDMPDDLKPVLARQMEVYAGFLEHTDHHIGRLVDALAELEILDDTLVYVIIGDNGASAEGTLNGTFNELLSLNGAGGPARRAEFMAARIDEFGTPEAYNHYAVGWAHAMDTPYQWTKQVASHWGGTRNGTIVHWPGGIDGQGRGPEPVPPRHRRRPDRARGGRPARADDRARRPAAPLEGVSMAYTLRRRRRRRAARDAVLRDVLQPRHLPPGLDRGHPALDPLGVRRRRCPPSTTTRWELYAPRRLDPGPRPRRRTARAAAPAAAAVHARGEQVQRLPARRPPGRAVQLRPGRPADPGPRQHASCCSAAWAG